MTRKGFITDFGKAALDAQRHARPIEQHRGFKSLALEPQRLQQVH
jgi:hypothetical protein